MLWFSRRLPGALTMRKILVVAGAAIGLSACASPETVRQAAIYNCLQVGITESDPQFPICARSYALQQQEGALTQNFKAEYDPNQRYRGIRHRADVFR
jgi:hypothetical protein